MAVHQRETIRKAAVTALTGLTTAGVRVYRTRVYPMDAAKLPGLIIYTLGESADIPSMSTADQVRELELVVEGYAQATPSTIDDTLDDLALEVETVIGANRTLSGACETCWLESTEIEVTAGETPGGVVKMTFKTIYRG